MLVSASVATAQDPDGSVRIPPRVRLILLALLLAAAFVSVSCALWETTHGPAVDFGWDLDPSDPLTLHFVSASTGASTDESPLVYQWNFGDGTPTTCSECSASTTAHRYKNRGHYQVQLAVTDANHTTRRCEPRQVTAGFGPTAKLLLPAIGLVNEPIHIDGSSSTDTPSDGSAGGHVTRWVFDFGDQTPVQDSGKSYADHPFASARTYHVKLTVYNDLGLSATDEKDIQIVQEIAGPTVQITKPRHGDVVEATITILATVKSDVRVTLVEFYVDRSLIGSTAALPPSLPWDTTTVTDGDHALTARAYNSANGVGISEPITVTVQNHR